MNTAGTHRRRTLRVVPGIDLVVAAGLSGTGRLGASSASRATVPPTAVGLRDAYEERHQAVHDEPHARP